MALRYKVLVWGKTSRLSELSGRCRSDKWSWWQAMLFQRRVHLFHDCNIRIHDRTGIFLTDFCLIVRFGKLSP